jgi:hypothetical protein
MIRPSAPVSVSLSWRRGIPFFALQRGRDNPLHFPVPLPSPSNPKGYGSLLQGWRESRQHNHLSRADAQNSKGTKRGRGREADACRGAVVDIAGVPAAAPQPYLRRREDEPRQRTHTSRGARVCRRSCRGAGERDLRRPLPQSASAPRLHRCVVVHHARELDSVIGRRSLSSSTASQAGEGRREQDRRARPRAREEKLTPPWRGIEEARWRRERMGGRGLAVVRARPRRGAGAGASSPWRSQGSGEGAPEGSTRGGLPPQARQIRRRREEGGGARQRRWSPARSAAGVVDCLASRRRERGATVTRWVRERGREKRGWVRERGVRWGKGWGMTTGSHVWVVWMKERNKG